MSYYTDLDNDLGSEEQVEIEGAESDFREWECKQFLKASTHKMKNEIRGAKVEVSCACCSTKFIARVADRNRGWARFCSKSCKAINQNNNLER